MGKKSAQNLLDGIAASKARGLTRLLAALSIPMVGESMAELLTAEFHSIDDLLASSKEKIAKIKGFGPNRAESAHDFFHTPDGHEAGAAICVSWESNSPKMRRQRRRAR